MSTRSSHTQMPKQPCCAQKNKRPQSHVGAKLLQGKESKKHRCNKKGTGETSIPTAKFKINESIGNTNSKHQDAIGGPKGLRCGAFSELRLGFGTRWHIFWRYPSNRCQYSFGAWRMGDPLKKHNEPLIRTSSEAICGSIVFAFGFFPVVPAPSFEMDEIDCQPLPLKNAWPLKNAFPLTNALKSYDGNEQFEMHHNIKQMKRWKMVFTISNVAQVALICSKVAYIKEVWHYLIW